MSEGPSPAMQANVLALNRAYVAVHVVSVRRAFCLLFKELAEVVNVEEGRYLSYDFGSWREMSQIQTELDLRDDQDDWVRAVNFEIQVPRVVRLLTYDRFPKNVVKFSRRNVFLRDRNCCQYCGGRFSSQRLSFDHVLPRSRGGPTCWENIVAACVRCNVRKGDRTPAEAGMRLRAAPVKPKRSPLLYQHLGHRKYECWKSFLDESVWENRCA